MSQKKSKSSYHWLLQHKKDVYVKKSYKLNLRSRSWFKLRELDNRCNIIKKNMLVMDLGSSPGGWSKYVVDKFNYKNKVIACDILSMQPIKGVHFFKGDLKNQQYIDVILKYLNKKKMNLIMSDMAPNISGNSCIDIAKSINLAQIALFMCKLLLINNGSFIVKIFQGDGFNEYLNIVRKYFLTVKIRKPNSSRIHSRELFIVAEGWIK